MPNKMRCRHECVSLRNVRDIYIIAVVTIRCLDTPTPTYYL